MNAAEGLGCAYRGSNRISGPSASKILAQRRDAMKDLIKRYLDNRISRRELLSGLGTLGITAAAANSMAQSLAPLLPPAGEDGAANAPSASRNVQGTGGALLVAQLKASGIEHIFFNPSSGAAPFF